jgi:uncharacterized protein (TIGR03435 family)
MLRSVIRGISIALLSYTAAGQPAPSPSFEAASVKVAAPTPGGGRASASGDTVAYNNTTLMNVLLRAFELKFSGQIAGPSWMFTERYDIVAKAPDNTPREQIPLLLRTLLVERFQLTLHRETRDLPMYALLRGRGRLKVSEGLVEDEKIPKNSIVINNGVREARSMNMASLAQLLSLLLRQPVLDMTGLPGYYDFPYELSMEESGNSSTPSIFTIVDELGLTLDSRKAPFDVVVVDGGNKTPTEN